MTAPRLEVGAAGGFEKAARGGLISPTSLTHPRPKEKALRRRHDEERPHARGTGAAPPALALRPRPRAGARRPLRLLRARPLPPAGAAPADAAALRRGRLPHQL